VLGIRRREFIRLVGGAAAWPLAARGQQTAMPVVGFLSPGSPESDAFTLTVFRQALNETGFVVDRNLALEYRGMQGHYDLLPALIADFVRRPAAVIVASGTTPGALAAKAATTTIPISRSEQLAALMQRHAVPTIDQNRAFATAGGLVSYGTREAVAGGLRLVGVYTGRILKGEKPTDLPVQQATNNELVINLKTAKALDITVPLTLRAFATEVIE
jgi:ABC-type uncharacterized transport system substrate-binding protein